MEKQNHNKKKNAAKKLQKYAFWQEVLANKEFTEAPKFGLHCEPSCSGGPHGCHCQ